MQVDRFITQSLCEKGAMQQTVTIVNQNSCHCNFFFHKQAMPFSQHLENFLTLNKFFSTKLKKKENIKYNKIKYTKKRKICK